MKFCSLVLELHLPQNFCHRHTERHFLQIVDSCSGHPKTCESTKNRMSENFTKPILSSIYIEKSKNWIFLAIKIIIMEIFVRFLHNLMQEYEIHFVNK